MNLCFLDVVFALMETLKQLHHEYDLNSSVKLEKAVCHWASILSSFTSFPEGRAALCEYHIV
jgi:hypothetical protein